MAYHLIKITWHIILSRSHGILSYLDHMAFCLNKITRHIILSRSHGILSNQDHMAFYLIKITWHFILSRSHDILSYQDHMAYFLVHSLAHSVYFFRSVLYSLAISGTRGSSGLGSHSMEQIDNNTCNNNTHNKLGHLENFRSNKIKY